MDNSIINTTKKVLNNSRFRLMFLSLILHFTLLSCAQSVPKKVCDAFLNKFVGARNIEWKQENEDSWVVFFYMEKFDDMTAHYTKSGKFQNFEIKIYDKDIPQNLACNIKQTYPMAEITEVYKKNSFKTTEYIFEILDNGELFAVNFNNDGTTTVIPKNDFRFQSRLLLANF